MFAVAGCGGDDDEEAGDGIPESQSEQIAAGQQIYATECAQCHGDQGQGGTGPMVVGGGKRIASYENTKRLYDYVSATMPFDAPGSLAPEQYWNVVAHLLNENDLLPQDTVLGPDSEPVELKRE